MLPNNNSLGGLCLLAPYSCPVGKVLFKGSAVGLRHDIQSYRHAAVVGNVFADGKLAVYGAPREFNAVKLLDHGVYLLFKLLLIGFCPPVVEVAQLVAFCTVGVEGVGDFMTDYRADAAQVFTSGLMDGVEGSSRRKAAIAEWRRGR